MIEQTVCYLAQDWYRITGRGDCAAIRVVSPGVDLGEIISISGHDYKIIGIEAPCIPERNRYIGKMIGVCVGERRI